MQQRCCVRAAKGSSYYSKETITVLFKYDDMLRQYGSAYQIGKVVL